MREDPASPDFNSPGERESTSGGRRVWRSSQSKKSPIQCPIFLMIDFVQRPTDARNELLSGGAVSVWLRAIRQLNSGRLIVSEIERSSSDASTAGCDSARTTIGQINNANPTNSATNLVSLREARRN